MIFKQRLFTALLGVLFATVLTDQTSALYDPGVGRFCSRDPIGYVDGLDLYRSYFVPWGVDWFGTSCSETPCITRCMALPTVGSTSGGGTGGVAITNPRQICIDSCKQAAKDFRDWFDEQIRKGKPDYGGLPDCPCDVNCKKTICVSAGTGAPGIPTEIDTVCAPNGWYVVPPVVYPLYLPDLHPGAVWDLRSSAPPPRTQCTYDAQGKLITTGTGIGTVDEGGIGEGHYPLDVTPVHLIITLEGGSLKSGCWFNLYKRVRPLRNGNKCPRNP